MFAPLRCSIRPEAQHCPRPAAEIGGGEVSPSYVRRNLNVRISQSAGLLVPRGGKRPGAGRKKGTKNKRRRTVVEAHAEVAMLAAAKPDTVTPLSHMMAVLNDPGSPPSRKDAAAVAAAPYMHPKLNLSATSELNGGGRLGPCQLTILSVPHGCQIIDGQLVWPDTGALATAEETEFKPYTGTPGLPALPDLSAAVERLEVIEPEPEDAGKVERLDVWRRRSGGDDV
jgi:hypothetical protein